MTQAEPRELFISYSRRNKDFALTLVDALQQCGRGAWIDLDAIPPSAEWWAEIKRGIDEAHTFVTILTPELLSSPVCTFEMHYAIKNNKRIIPLVRGDVVKAQSLGNIAAVEPSGFLAEILGNADLLDLARNNWRTVEKLNWIFIRETDDFAQAFERFLYALDTDLEQVRLHTRLLTRSRDWIERGRDPAYLLVGSDLRNAASWLKVYGDIAPKATAEQRQLIDASLKQESDELAAEARRRQTLRRTVVALAIVAVIALAAGMFGLVQTNAARQQQQNAGTAIRNAALADTRVAFANATLTPISAAIATGEQRIRIGEGRIESQRLAALSGEVLRRGDSITAALLGVRALRAGYSEQADTALNSALHAGVAQVALRGHEHWAVSGAFSPDARLVLTGSVDGTARLWDAATGLEIHRYEGHTGSVQGVAFSPTGRLIVTGSSDHTARLWDVVTGEEIRQFVGHEDGITSVAFSPDGQSILTGSADHTARLWDAVTGKETRRFVGHTDTVYSVAFSLDGQQIVTGSADHTVRLWDAATGEEVLQFEGHEDVVRSVAIRPNFQDYVLSASWDNTARLWNIATGEEVQRIDTTTFGGSAAAFSNDGRYVAVADGNTVGVYDSDTGERVQTVGWYNDIVSGVVFSPDGQSILTLCCSTDYFDDWMVPIIWEAPDRHDPRELPAGYYTFGRQGVAYSPDQRYLAVTDNFFSVRNTYTAFIVDLASIENIGQLDPSSADVNGVRSVSYSPDGRYLVTSGSEGTILWDAASHDALYRSEGYQSYSAVFSPDGSQVLASAESDALLWDVATGEEIRRFQGHTDTVLAIDMSANGQHVLTGSADTTLRLWDAATGHEIRQFEGLTGEVVSVAFSPDDRYVLAAGNDIAKLWETATGVEVQQFIGHRGAVMSATFSPDGLFILTASADSTAIVWNAQTGERVRTFSGTTSPVNSATYNPDGRFIVIASGDSFREEWRLTVNDADYQDFIVYACSRLGTVRDFTSEQRTLYGILDSQPTCPQFVTAENPMIPPFPPTITGVPTRTIPAFTPAYPVTPTPTSSLTDVSAGVAHIGEQRGEIAPYSRRVWTYEGRAGELITVTILADNPASGIDFYSIVELDKFDPWLTILSPDGNVLFENDDRNSARLPDGTVIDTDSQIANLVLAVDGFYTIEIRSAYWEESSGAYTLIIESSLNVPATATLTP